MSTGISYVLSSDIVVACPGSAGTISEIALALKNKKNVILMNFDTKGLLANYRRLGLLHSARSPEEVIKTIKGLFG